MHIQTSWLTGVSLKTSETKKPSIILWVCEVEGGITSSFLSQGTICLFIIPGKNCKNFLKNIPFYIVIYFFIEDVGISDASLKPCAQFLKAWSETQVSTMRIWNIKEKTNNWKVGRQLPRAMNTIDIFDVLHCYMFGRIFPTSLSNVTLVCFGKKYTSHLQPYSFTQRHFVSTVEWCLCATVFVVLINAILNCGLFIVHRERERECCWQLAFVNHD